MNKEEIPATIAFEFTTASKALVGIVVSVLGFLSVSTWNTVNNSSLDIVRLQTKFSSIEDKVTTIKTICEDKNDSTNKRLTALEAQVIIIQKTTDKEK